MKRLNQYIRIFKYASVLLVGILGSAFAAPAAELKPLTFPLLFDARERLAKPDLTTLPRLRFLTTLDFPPFNFADEAGRPTGFQVDLARAICAELDIVAKCQIEAMPFAELRPALDNRQGEAIIAGMAVTPDLRQSYLVSRPFMVLPARFLKRRELPVEGPAALSLAGQAVGVVEKSAHEAMLKAWFPALKPVAFKDYAALTGALANGKIAAAFGDGVRLTFWNASADARNCCQLVDGPYVSDQFLGEGLTIQFAPDQSLLQQAVDHALLSLSRKGRLKELYLRYFPYGLY